MLHQPCLRTPSAPSRSSSDRLSFHVPAHLMTVSPTDHHVSSSTDHHMIAVRNSQRAAFSDISISLPLHPVSSSPPLPPLCDVNVGNLGHTNVMACMWKSEDNLWHWSCLTSSLRSGLLLFSFSLHRLVGWCASRDPPSPTSP